MVIGFGRLQRSTSGYTLGAIRACRATKSIHLQREFPYKEHSVTRCKFLTARCWSAGDFFEHIWCLRILVIREVVRRGCKEKHCTRLYTIACRIFQGNAQGVPALTMMTQSDCSPLLTSHCAPKLGILTVLPLLLVLS